MDKHQRAHEKQSKIYAQFHTKYAETMIRWAAYHLSGTRSLEAGDLTTEIWLRLFRQSIVPLRTGDEPAIVLEIANGEYTIRRGHIVYPAEPYLRVSVRNECRHSLQSYHKEMARTDRDGVDHRQDPFPALDRQHNPEKIVIESNALWAAFRDALNGAPLSNRERICLILNAYDCSDVEIAAVLGTSAGAVRKCLCVARRELRDWRKQQQSEE